MFSDGTLIVAEDGSVRKANKKEVQEFLKSASEDKVVAYLSGVFPKEHNGNGLTHVRLDKESGIAYGKYANSSKLLKLKVLAQSAPAKQTEPLNSGDKSDPDLNIPRNEKKGKPQEFKGREDINNPTKIRDEKYDMGKGAKDLHTNEVPRDKSGDGIGGKSVDFEDENGKDVSSGNPDTYVQEFTESEKPESAGSEKNHAVARNNSEIKVKFASDDLRFKFAEGKDKEDHDSEESEDKKDEKPGKKLPPWLKDKKDGKGSDEKAGEEKEAATNEVVELKQKLASSSKQVQKLEREISNRKIAEARKEAAIGLVLAYRDRQPEKYASAEAFNEKVTEIAKKMSVEAIESAMDEFNTLIRAEADKQKKTAAQSETRNGNPSLSHPVVIPQQNYKFASDARDPEDLASILMQSTTLGRNVSAYERYHNSINE